MYITNSQIQFKTTILKSSLCYNSDAYLLVKETITVVGAETTPATMQANRTNKQGKFKNCRPSTYCITEINNTHADYANDFDVSMPMYNLIENSDNYSKIFGSLNQFYRDESKNSITYS